MRNRFIAIGLAAFLALSACGDTLAQQALFGAGAGAGAAIITGGNAGTGAAVGMVGNVAYCQTYPSQC